jgi:hypothetical protein
VYHPLINTHENEIKHWILMFDSLINSAQSSLFLLTLMIP